MDLPEPPVIGEYLSVYFPHRDWQKFLKTYCVDTRPMPDDGDIWEFEVTTNIRDKVDLSFEGLESIPENFEIWLLDETAKITLDLRQTNSHSVAGRGEQHPSQLKMVIGKQEFVHEKVTQFQAIPVDYVLCQNFPNPFNPSTTIRYGLPKEAKVTLKIYNILGEEVVTLVKDELTKVGYHVAIWDGRNQAGRLAANGIYFILMQSGNFTQSRKMLLIE